MKENAEIDCHKEDWLLSSIRLQKSGVIDSDVATKLVGCVVVDDYCVLKQLLFVDVVIVVVMFFV